MIDMKIGFFGPRFNKKEELEKKLRQAGITSDIYFSEQVIDEEHLPEDKNFDILCVFTDSTINAKVFESLPALKFIAVEATGFDNIDLKVASEKGVLASNVPSYGENTVAEFTFGLILNLSRKIFECVDQIKEIGNFRVDSLTGFDLNGKVLGVVGTGHIGKHVIKIAKGFDMEVFAFDAYPNESLSGELGFAYVSLPELLAGSDIITLHVPYMKETHHLISTKEFEQMKNGSYIVNTSRGAVIDTAALIKALRDKKLAGAALDVLEEEGVVRDEMEFLKRGRTEEHDMKTVLANHILVDMPGVLITPHNAFNSREAFQRIEDTTVSNIKLFLDGKPDNIVKAK